jgi:hypothetical protein
MLDSLRRYVTFEGVSESTGEFFGGGAWRSEMDEAMVRFGSREAAILDVYLRRLKAAGGFTYVATTRVRDPDAARTYFHLAYGTRHPAGIEVFRRCEKRCVEIQERIVVESYHVRRERDQGVQDLFRQAGDENFVVFSKWKDDSRARAKAEFDEWLTGLTVVHRRAVDTLGVMLSNGTITPAMHDAGQVFRAQFQRAALHGVRVASLLRITGTAQPSLTEAQGIAREQVARALEALGGFDSPCGSIAWHVLGLEISIRDWARRQGWGGRLMHPAQAQGTLISALGVLAAHYRLEIRPRAA